MSSSSSTTGRRTGIPLVARSRSAWRSGSPGMRTPGVPGIGFVLRNVRIQSSIWRLNSSGIDEPVDPQRAEEVADALAHAARRNLLAQREGRREGPPVRARENAAQDIDHGGEAVAFVPARVAVAAQGQHRAAVDHRARICPCRARRGRSPSRAGSARRGALRSRSCRTRRRWWRGRSRSAAPRGRGTRWRSDWFPTFARLPRAARRASSSWSSPSRSGRARAPSST